MASGALEALAHGSASRPWLNECLERGLLLDAGSAPAFGARSLQNERLLRVAPTLRPHLLKKLSELQGVETVSDLVKRAFRDNPTAEFSLRMYGGDWSKLAAAFAELKRRTVTGEATTHARATLHEAMCVGFNAEWLQNTWAEHAWPLAVQALSDAVGPLADVGEVYAWVLRRIEVERDAASARVLIEHAILRNDPDTLRRLLPLLPPSEGALVAAVLEFLEGDVEPARALSKELTAGRGKRALSPCASVTALLALLSAGRDTSGAKPKLPSALLSAPSADSAPIAGWPPSTQRASVSRAVRTLFRRSTQADTQQVRLRAYQVPADADAWEPLILALTVHLEEKDPVTREAWSRRLRSDGVHYAAAGYQWFAYQALHLAKALAASSDPELDQLTPPTGQLLLTDLLEPDPEWRKALWQLSAFAERAEGQPLALSRRVAWYVDMGRAEPAKPALEEFKPGVGWSRMRRVDLPELYEQIDTLPPEDSAVLRALDPKLRRGKLPLELLEALVGHPRVYNGARGRLLVEVMRERCRIETRNEHGHLVVAVRPSGAVEGLNVVVDSESRVSVYRVSAELAKLVSHLPAGVRIPESHRKEAFEVLARLAEHVEVQSAELGARRRLEGNSTPHLRIAAQSGAWYVELGVRPFGADGRFFQPASGRAAVTQHDTSELLDTERDFARELELAQSLIDACPTLKAAQQLEAESGVAQSFSFTFDQEQLLSMLSELEQAEVKCSLEWKGSPMLRSKGHVTLGQLKGRLRRIKGWYLVSGKVAIDEVNDLTLAELVRAPFTQSGRFVQLEDGNFVEVERRVRNLLTLLANVTEHGARRARRSDEGAADLQVPEAALGALRALLDSGAEWEGEGDARGWLGTVDEGLREPISTPDALMAELRDYQVEGYQWLTRMSRLGLGVCLADDMGLGKTLQVLALLLTRAHLGPALVVAPTSVCSNWLSEAQRFTPTLRAVEYAGKGRKELLQRVMAGGASDEPRRAAAGIDPPSIDLVIVSYALLQQDAAELGAHSWSTAVLDEAQFIKNALSLRAKAAFALNAQYRLALTGTPVENHLGDLWSIFHFLNPALLGGWKHFQLRFLKPIERENDQEQRSQLRTLLQPFLLRRRKDEVLSELPPLTVIRHDVQLNDDENRRYAILRREIHEKLRTPWGKRQHRLQIFAEITRLRRFCCHPRLVFPDASYESSKLDAFLELVEELRDNGHSALVFSQFVDFLGLVREQLDERRLRYLYLDGSTPKEQRSRLVSEFQAGGVGLFLISLKAGGFGLNLTAADYVIHLDPWWNPAVEAQASDRAHRIGQDRPVTVYRLITRDTIEESILSLHGEKRALAEAVLEGTASAGELDVEQLLQLLEPAPSL